MISTPGKATLSASDNARMGVSGDRLARLMARLKRADARKLFQRQAEKFLELRRAFKLVFESAPGWTLAYLALIVVQAGLPVAVLYSFKLVIDQVSKVLSAGHGAADMRQLWMLIGLSAAANLVVLLFRALSNVVTEAQAQQVTDHLQGVLHSKSVSVDLEYYENDQYQDSLHRAQQEAAFRPTRIVQASAQIGQNFLCLLAVAGFLLISLPWIFCVVLVLAAAPGVITRMKHARKMFEWQRERTATERKIEYFNWMLTGPNYAKEIRLFDLGGLFKGRTRELRTDLRRQRLALTTRRSINEFVSQTSATLAVFGCFGYVAYRTAQGLMSLGELVMLYQAFQRGLGFLTDLLGGLANLYENSLFLTNLYHFLDLKEKVAEPVSPRPFPQPLRRAIRFEEVSFGYAGAESRVLDRISFEIKAGEMVALVGPNGAGKSTMIKLLCRLYDPTEGRITVDGIDLRDFSKDVLRKNVSVMFQDFAHYYLPARENIWLGNPEPDMDQSAIEAAARDADIHTQLLKLPRGYSTVLGKVFEGGEELSMGEWQRIALARAFLR
ncbi:MAG: ABC transporter ATP-binding protein, partial [Akkermansiaceae bacterium]|nr:ABC transporter ATP-binding protein [Verrucomicrobiales bacterium]